MSRIKASELVKYIQGHIEAHGDLPVSLTASINGQITSFDEVFVGFDERPMDDETGSEINIRNFIY